jgi:hypothetical protein
VRLRLEIQRANGVDIRKVSPSTSEARYGCAEGACPGCGAIPFYVAGSGPTIHSRDTWRANGHAVCCGDPVGYLYAEVDTLFGTEEDRTMLEFGRARVYR